MAFSEFLNSKRSDCKALVNELSKVFPYVGILGSDVRSTVIGADKNMRDISEGTLSECGFVIKMHSGKAFYEYSLDDISGDKKSLAQKIINSVKVSDSISNREINVPLPQDEPLVQSFSRQCDFENFTDEELLDFAKSVSDKILASDPGFMNAVVRVLPFTVSKLFISANRELDQFYSWANVIGIGVYSNGEKTVLPREGTYSNLLGEAMDSFGDKIARLAEKARKLVSAKPIVPGVYDVITDPSISGLIAHEAFGHGVEMDQFVKDRALAKQYVGKYVASPICNMHDGAAAAFSTASYFFDDDGVLAHDTQIIRDGILVSGISDLVSATELGTAPTGNGRRQSYKRKAYTRMTNTFFSPGKDKLEDMIKSVKHGYMLFETNNGMEDPKNWQIQCTAEYGIEIVDGKLTDNYVSPVVMSGSVPDLLKSISMVSDDFRIIGMGSCGKGYKEWVRVSDGGPALKVRVKLA
ncbi:MAG: TldD/PmbA family protein [Clostridia bacterium]|nr:TldD/PmbA family protein [Clostridia bacterium]